MVPVVKGMNVVAAWAVVRVARPALAPEREQRVVVAISAAVLPVPRVRSPKNWPKLSRLVGCLTMSTRLWAVSDILFT